MNDKAASYRLETKTQAQPKPFTILTRTSLRLQHGDYPKLQNLSPSNFTDQSPPTLGSVISTPNDISWLKLR